MLLHKINLRSSIEELKDLPAEGKVGCCIFLLQRI